MSVTKAGTIAALAVLAAGCGQDPSDRSELSVFAATSLTDAFGALEKAFEAANPDVDVVTNFAGSQVLRLQIEQGASARVFASANEEHARALVDAGLAAEPVTLALNRLVLIVPPENPAGIASIRDLTRARRVVVGTGAVPIGRYTRALLERAGRLYGPEFVEAVRARIVSEESNVRLVRAKVELGEADAAVVYRTDALASDRVHTIALPAELDVPVRYVVTTLGDALPGPEARTAAERFLAFALSDPGRAILTRHGFDVDPT